MKLVQHPHVVRLYEVIDTQTKLYLILEYGDGGDMYDHIMKHDNGEFVFPAGFRFARGCCMLFISGVAVRLLCPARNGSRLRCRRPSAIDRRQSRIDH